MRQRLSNLVKQTVRSLRKDQTEAEKVLWRALKDRKLSGKKFLRQHPIVFEWQGRERFLIADFYCHEAKLVIEVDGGVHEQQKDYDEAREYVLKSLGLSIVRFRNAEIIDQLRISLDALRVYLKPSQPSLSKRGGSVLR
ncbi:MAG: endonuclease domain-containing protein [Candidatus Margulisiibacteriota bacterium]